MQKSDGGIFLPFGKKEQSPRMNGPTSPLRCVRCDRPVLFQKSKRFKKQVVLIRSWGPGKTSRQVFNIVANPLCDECAKKVQALYEEF